ncbi:hypothetical protein PYCC9005_005358 [Savitreella phatthalungensis]
MGEVPGLKMAVRKRSRTPCEECRQAHRYCKHRDIISKPVNKTALLAPKISTTLSNKSLMVSLLAPTKAFNWLQLHVNDRAWADVLGDAVLDNDSVFHAFMSFRLALIQGKSAAQDVEFLSHQQLAIAGLAQKVTCLDGSELLRQYCFMTCALLAISSVCSGEKYDTFKQHAHGIRAILEGPEKRTDMGLRVRGSSHEASLPITVDVGVSKRNQLLLDTFREAYPGVDEVRVLSWKEDAGTPVHLCRVAMYAFDLAKRPGKLDRQQEAINLLHGLGAYRTCASFKRIDTDEPFLIAVQEAVYDILVSLASARD